MNLFLVPATEDNIERSIRGSVSRNFLEGHLTSSQVDEIKKAYNNHQPAHCWALTERNRKKFSRMRADDIVLFSLKGTGKFNYMGVVACKMDCPIEFGQSLWPFTPKNPWTLVYFLKDVIHVNIDKARLVTDLGYKPNFVVPGTTRVGSDRLRNLTGSYGPLSTAIEANQSA